MAVFWHPLGLDHPLVKQLDEISRAENANFHRRQRFARGEDGQESVPALEDQLADLQDQRRSVEAELRCVEAERAPEGSQTIQQRISQKRRQITRLTQEVAELRQQLREIAGTSSAEEELKKQLSLEKLTVDARRTSAG